MHSLIRCMCIDKPVVLSDQLVGADVRIGDEGASPGDRGYVPVVVVGVSIRVAFAVLADIQKQ